MDNIVVFMIIAYISSDELSSALKESCLIAWCLPFVYSFFVLKKRENLSKFSCSLLNPGLL